ncbi:MAG: SRPBCC family protein [Pseudomonadota bacterium]
MFQSHIDVPLSIEAVWREMEDPQNWRHWMYGTWTYGELSTRDPGVSGAVPLQRNGASVYIDDVLYEPFRKIAIRGDEFALTKLNDLATRINYRQTIQHDGVLDKAGWYLSVYWLGGWSLHSRRISALYQHLTRAAVDRR